MIYLVLPLGSHFGWGVCGKYVTIEMAQLAPVRLLAQDFNAASVGDELDYYALTQILPSAEEIARVNNLQGGRLDGPLLMTITDKSMRPKVANLRGTRTVGYTFFEENLLPAEAVETARQSYDHVAAGSSWCESALRQAGLTEVSTVVQGIDPTIFEPTPVERRYLRDRFVIFSGGKLELRKGQDLVVRAFKVLQDKYRDVLLITSWSNPWRFSVETMRSSPHVKFTAAAGDHPTMMRQFLSENGIDVRRTINLPPQPNVTMARIYKQTDVGLFPNRCEGGTNLVLMEYMACGKPVIASFSSGHKDILTSDNALMLRALKPLTIQHNQTPVATWDEPSLDEVVAQLEFAYANRDKLRPIAHRAGEDLKRFTWRNTAEQFHAELTRPTP
jgi:glycosyltransferase involved in cell wall biosynthesis